VAPDPKKKALADAQKAQAAFEKTQKELDDRAKARRESFERAKSAGATHREIGEAVGLHHTRVGQVIRGG
jgi:hypothetical protein